MEILLARDGVFPVAFSASGDPLPGRPASGLSLPGTVQGEGKLAGVPSLFVRMAGCDLRCSWTAADGSRCPCDTAYASFALSGAFRMDVADVARLVAANLGAVRHVVVTGGEPFLQPAPLRELLAALKAIGPLHITVETNATLYDDPAARLVDLFSLSPKLASSAPSGDAAHHRLRLNLPAVQAFLDRARADGKDFQLKFVYARPADADEILSILARLRGWTPSDVLLMPLGATPAEMARAVPSALEQCLRHGWRFCDRLHISLFGNREGV